MNKEIVSVLSALGTAVEQESEGLTSDIEELLREIGVDVEAGDIQESLKEIREIEGELE